MKPEHDIVCTSCEKRTKPGYDGNISYGCPERDPTNKYMKELVAVLSDLREKGTITLLQYKHLYPTSTIATKFY